MKSFGNRLAGRIVALMVLASAALSVVAATVQLYFSYQNDLNRVLAEIETVERSFLYGLENALWQFNFSQVEVLIDGVYAQTDIVAVSLVAATGQSFSRGTADGENMLEQQFQLIHTHADGREESVGELSLTVSLANIRQRLWAQFLTLIASNFLKSLAASVLMLLIFERMVSRHLRRITGYVTDVDWDCRDNELALERRQPDGSDDELSNIVSALNHSRSRLQSSRKRADQLSERMQAVLNATTSGIVAFDSNGQIAMINPAAQHMLGVLESELPCGWPANITFLDRENMSPLTEAQAPVTRILAGQTLVEEVSLMSRVTQPSDARYVRISNSSPEHGGENGVRAVMVIDDVTEAEENRQQFERAGRLDALGQLTGGVAHDFNNLLAAISYSMDLAKHSETDTERTGYIDAAMASVDRGASLARRLLAFAKRQPAVTVSRSATEILAEFETLVGPTIEETIKLTIEPPARDLYVWCDVAQLDNALLNLVLNARDAILGAGVAGRICVKASGTQPPSVLSEGQEQTGTRGTGGFVEFSVTDTGPGMGDEVKRRALDPFFTTKDDNSGTGLGLSIVYGFTQQARGQLKIETEPGQGTTVRLILPRGERPKPDNEKVAPLAKRKGAGQTILLVEDEANLAKLMGEVIKKFGYRVVRVADGEAAVKVLQSGETVDLLLTDVVMPGNLGGFELAEVARQVRPALPIIYMSGYTGFSKEQMGAVVAPILAKPTSPDDVATALFDAFDTDG